MTTIDLSDLSHSYPFLHLSKKFVVPYRDVLEYAERVDDAIQLRRDYQVSVQPPVTGLQRAVVAVCRAPWRWDMSKSMEVGL